jgi:hypothetical protein
MRRRRRHRWPWVTLATVVGVLVLGTGGLYAYDATRADVVAKGVTAGGVDVGGLGATAARTRLRRALVPRLVRPVTLVARGRTFVVTPRQLRLAVDVDGMVSEAVQESRRGSFVARALRDVRGRAIHVAVPVRVRYSDAAVAGIVGGIDRTLRMRARDAEVLPSATTLQVVRSHTGIAVRRSLLHQALVRALTDPDARHVLAVPMRTVVPKVTTAALAKRYPAYLTICRSCFELRLWVHLRLKKVYRIAVGRAGLETPAGLYSIDDKQVNPSWHVPNSAWAGPLAGQVIPPGPDDPIKARWMGFWNGAGIHGTDEIWSLGTAASHGCIRMSIPDVIELYDQVPLHTPIYVG